MCETWDEIHNKNKNALLKSQKNVKCWQKTSEVIEEVNGFL